MHISRSIALLSMLIASGAVYTAACGSAISDLTDVDLPDSGLSGVDASSGGSSSGDASSDGSSGGQFAIGGNVTGLVGTGLVLANKGDTVAVTTGAGAVPFAFPKKLATGSAYDVTVQTSPSGPPQTCTVGSGQGTVATSNVTNVSVTCALSKFKVGGTITGLTSGTLVLQNNGGDDLSRMADGAFEFANGVEFGANYAVTVLSKPAGLACTVAEASGTISGAVTNVAVTCVPCTGTQTFAATGIVDDFVVPACAESVKITAGGAQGGNSNGGKGAVMSGNFAVTGGETLKVVAGMQGVVNNCGGSGASGGGGGGSFVWRESSLAAPMIAAGGGGGGNMNWGDTTCRFGLDAVVTADGLKGNSAVSALGGVGGEGGLGNAPSGTGAGGAGWLSAGGDSTWGAGGGKGGATKPGFSGGAGGSSFGPGGEGGFGGGGGATCGCGGGGGYSGGGAGDGNICRSGGGGGGSYNAGSDQVNAAGAVTGNGYVTFEW